jgi:hypothetical protein
MRTGPNEQSPAALIGIWGGGYAGLPDSKRPPAHANYACHVTFENLTFYRLGVGINGDQFRGYKLATGFFDSTFRGIVTSHCFVGLAVHGSGNVAYQPLINHCGTGLVLGGVGAEGQAGLLVLGGTFWGNELDISISPDAVAEGIKPCSFVGTAFEASKRGIVWLPRTSPTMVNALSFVNCGISTDAGGLLDLASAFGAVTLDNCCLAGRREDVRGPLVGRLKISNCLFKYAGQLSYVDEEKTRTGNLEKAAKALRKK